VSPYDVEYDVNPSIHRPYMSSLSSPANEHTSTGYAAPNLFVPNSFSLIPSHQSSLQDLRTQSARTLLDQIPITPFEIRPRVQVEPMDQSRSFHCSASKRKIYCNDRSRKRPYHFWKHAYCRHLLTVDIWAPHSKDRATDTGSSNTTQSKRNTDFTVDPSVSADCLRSATPYIEGRHSIQRAFPVRLLRCLFLSYMRLEVGN
jgi:hypothetical protein